MSTGFLIVCVSPYQGANPYKDRPDGAVAVAALLTVIADNSVNAPTPFATFRLCALPMQPATPPVIVANAHSGLRAVLGYREVTRLALLNNPEPLLWTKCALLISSFHLIPTCLIRSPMLQFVGVVFDIPAAQCKDGLR